MLSYLFLIFTFTSRFFFTLSYVHGALADEGDLVLVERGLAVEELRDLPLPALHLDGPALRGSDRIHQDVPVLVELPPVRAPALLELVFPELGGIQLRRPNMVGQQRRSHVVIHIDSLGLRRSDGHPCHPELSSRSQTATTMS